MSLSVLSTSKEPTTSNMLETNNITDGNSQLVVMNIKTTTTTTVTTNSNNDDTDSKFFKHLDKKKYRMFPILCRFLAEFLWILKLWRKGLME